MINKLTSNKAKEILHDKSVHGHPLTDKQRRFFGAIAGGAPIKAEHGRWLDKYADGGFTTTTETTKPPFQLTQMHRKGWEAYRDYLDKKGLYGDERLNHAFGKTTFNNWIKKNPQYDLSWDVLPYIGEDIQKQKQQMLQAEKKGNFEYYEDGKKMPVSVANPTIETNLKSKNTWWPGTEFTSQGYSPFEEELYEDGKLVESVKHGLITPDSSLQPDLKNFKTVAKQKYGGEAGYTDIPFNYNSAWGGQFAMGGSLPGAVGFTYARTGGIPSNGPYAKKTKASAQNGMTYYQHGLDWKPKSISKNGSVIEDNRGQWAHPGKITKINSNQITMKGVDYPVLGISDTGDRKMMYPDQEYTFKGKTVTEYPQKKNGGWLDKYK